MILFKFFKFSNKFFNLTLNKKSVQFVKVDQNLTKNDSKMWFILFRTYFHRASNIIKDPLFSNKKTEPFDKIYNREIILEILIFFLFEKWYFFKDVNFDQKSWFLGGFKLFCLYIFRGLS